MKRGITRREREVTDIREILGILDRARVVHVGMIDADRPYVVPMNYGYTMEEGKLTLYLHGTTKGRKLDVIRANPRVFIEIDTDVVPFEGDVACRYGTGYSCIMGDGQARIIEDAARRRQAMSILMKTQTGKDFEFNDLMLGGVTMIAIEVDAFTAKKRPLPGQG